MIDEILKSRKILITCGTGGVGKTTLSAALAIRAAMLGKKTVVVTMDPAKRLASALGLSHLGDDPTEITRHVQEALSEHHPELGQIQGQVWAIMPDTRKTFENFVGELAPNPATADRIMRNPIFQIFTKEFSGTNEYMALERLYSLIQENRFETIILDTPPSRNTLAFLKAPQLLARFFEERLIRWLVLPTNKLVSAGMRKALGILEKLTGAGFMTHLFDFAAGLFEVQVAFTANLKRITAVLQSKDVGFIMVTTPTPDTMQESLRFIEQIKEHRFNFDGVALNRGLSYLRTPGQILDRKYDAAFSVIEAVQKREKLVLEGLEKSKIQICAKVPELARDVHSVEDLFHVAMAFNSHSFTQ